MSRDSADAVVVGGGVVGCSIAYHLARRGATVVLVERDTLGSQSTGRCAGGVRRQFSSSANVVMQQLSVELLAGLEAETGVDPEFRHIGYLFVLTSDKQVEDFRRFLLMWHETGVTDARWLGSCEAAGGQVHRRRRGRRHRPAGGTRAVRAHHGRRDLNVCGIQLRRSVGAQGRRVGRGRHPDRALPAQHLRDQPHARRVAPAPDDDRLRDLVLLPSRGRRAPVRNGNGRRTAEL
ncbi:MAG: FAD-binding oxidoreductase [Chloroflexi bacterium]|nr:MAG: FAD-binding oxidoreductase [Chloroflexota bacterium]